MRESATRALAQCLRAIEEGQEASIACLARTPEHRDELEPLIETAALLRAAPEATLRPAFLQTARRRLLERLPARRPVTFWDRFLAHWRPSPRTLYALRLAVALLWVIALVGVLLGSGRIVSAPGEALPGDVLYPVKVAVEESQLALAGDERAFGLYLEFARVRIDELERLSAMNRFEKVPVVASRFERQVQGAAAAVAAVSGQDAVRSQALAEQLDASLSTYRASLSQLLETSPASVRPALERALQDVDDELEDENEGSHVGEPEESDEEESRLDSTGSDVDAEREHELNSNESSEADSEAEGSEGSEDSTPDDGIGDDADDGSDDDPEGAEDGKDGTAEGDDPDGDSESEEDVEDDVYGGDSPDEESDSSEEGAEGGANDSDDLEEDSDSGAQVTGDDDLSDSSEGSDVEEGSDSDSATFGSSDDNSPDSQDGESDSDQEHDSDSDQDSESDGLSGSGSDSPNGSEGDSGDDDESD